MVESKSPWREALLDAYVGLLARRRFRHVRAHGFPGWQNWLAGDEPWPLVLFGNHETWWDGLLDFRLTRRFGLDARLMMEAKNLRRYPYFQRCGVFGVELDSPRGRAASLLHACRLLQAPSRRRCLILYPHGRLVPAGETPPALQGGLAALLRRAPGATALPVWRRIAISHHAKPEADLFLGEPLRPGDDRDTPALQMALAAARDACQRHWAEPGPESLSLVGGGGLKSPD